MFEREELIKGIHTSCLTAESWDYSPTNASRDLIICTSSESATTAAGSHGGSQLEATIFSDCDCNDAHAKRRCEDMHVSRVRVGEKQNHVSSLWSSPLSLKLFPEDAAEEDIVEDIVRCNFKFIYTCGYQIIISPISECRRY